MSTFLELCQDTTRESGTVAGTLPAAVTAQTGRLLKHVYWTQQAWVRIQNYRRDWRFLRKTFTGQTAAGSGVYTGAGSWSITDFGRWITDQRSRNYFPVSIYETALGVADENYLSEVDYEFWRQTYARGAQTNNRPNVYAISPANEFCLGPIPDKVYTVNGEYYRTAQVLAANGDIPILPDRFHQIIPWRALILLHENDEAELHIATAQVNYRELLEDLERDQLPSIRLGGGPIA